MRITTRNVISALTSIRTPSVRSNFGPASTRGGPPGSRLRNRNSTGRAAVYMFTIFCPNGRNLGANYAESFDRIRAAQDSHPDHGFLRCARIFAERLGILGA